MIIDDPAWEVRLISTNTNKLNFKGIMNKKDTEKLIKKLQDDITHLEKRIEWDTATLASVGKNVHDLMDIKEVLCKSIKELKEVITKDLQQEDSEE